MRRARGLYGLLCLLGAVFAVIVVPGAADADSGGGAAAYMGMGVGARALGMGSAFTAVADDASASYWNPAGLVSIGRPQLGAMHADLTLDRSYDYMGYAVPIGEKYAVAASYTRFSVDDIPETRLSSTDDDGNGLLDDPVLDGSGNVRIFGMFEDVEDNFTLSLAGRPMGGLMVGANLKFLHQRLYDTSATGWGLDVGAIFRVSSRLKVGVALRDLFSELDFGSGLRTEDVPLTWSTGFAYRMPWDATLALDVVKTENSDAFVRVGAEKWFMNRRYALRVGSDDGEFTAGTSFSFSDWRFDYAYATSDLGDVQRLSFVRTF